MSAEPVERIQEALSRLRAALPEETVADLLEAVGPLTATDGQDHAFTADQEDVLARAGMPPVAPIRFTERPSTLAWQAAARITAEAYTAAEVAALLGVGASRVRQHVSRRTLLTIATADGPRFPRYQFVEDRILPGWDVVARAFPRDAHPVAVEAFLSRVSEELEIDGQLVSPWEWLVTGGTPVVVAESVDQIYRLR